METILEEGETTASSKTAGITADYVITVDGQHLTLFGKVERETFEYVFEKQE